VVVICNRVLRVSACLSVFAACSGDPSRGAGTRPPLPQQPAPVAGAGGAAPAAGANGSAGSFGNPQPGGPTGPTTPHDAGVGVADGGECSGIDEVAPNKVLPADIIIVIDQSGSMDEETQFVQGQLNTFSQRIVDSGIDVHVILIAERPGGPEGDNPICVPPPLAGADCADNAPIFRQVSQHVDSHNAWDLILSSYAQYADLIRPESQKHVLVITDDVPENVTGQQFDQMLRALDATAFASYVHHAIFAFTAPDELACALGGVTDTCCGLAAGAGDAYGQLCDQTGGIRANLCEQNFEPVWAALATQVVESATLACEWAIPPPPAGATFDREKVNVRYSGDGQAEQLVGFVKTPGDCANVANGWYYDDSTDPPSRVLVCPQTCTAIQSLTSARVAIVFGCKTEEAPPE